MSHSRSSHRLALAACGALIALGATACGGDATEQGAAPTSSPEGGVSSAAPTSSVPPTAEGALPAERPEDVTTEVHPPESGSTEPAEPAPAPDPSGGAPAPAPAPAPTPAPGAGDFVGLLERQGATPPPGKDAVQLAQEACSRFDQGQTMMDISRWLGDEAGFDPDKQGFFLGAAVPTYCPANIAKMG